MESNRNTQNEEDHSTDQGEDCVDYSYHGTLPIPPLSKSEIRRQIYDNKRKINFSFFPPPYLFFQITPKKIIFLDIDGVIYIGSSDDHGEREDQIPALKAKVKEKGKFSADEIDSVDDFHSLTGFNQVAVNNVRNLCIKHDAKIVLSSSWREDRTIQQLKIIFAALDLDEYLLDTTDIAGYPFGREHEIIEWLSRHPEVISFVIIDDMYLDLKPFMKERFVRCFQLFDHQKLFEHADKVLSKQLMTKNDLIRSIYEEIMKPTHNIAF